jgi:putative transposase
MSRYRRDKTPGATWFFTVVTFRRRDLLCDEPIRIALREAIRKARIKHPFNIDGWVLMPNHLHCIWTLPAGDADFSLRWKLIKGAVTRDCKRHYPHMQCAPGTKLRRRESAIWQRRFWEHRIRDERDYTHHMDYLHYNPVRHGLCSTPSDWPYSTLHRLIAQGRYPADWAAERPPEFGEDEQYGEV